MRYSFLVLFLFLLCTGSLAQRVETPYTPERILIERGGITNDGICVDNNTRLRTQILPSKGYLRIGNNYSIINCAQYDKDNNFVGMLPLNYYNGAYYWDSDYKIRISFSLKGEPRKTIELKNGIVIDYGEDLTDLLSEPEIDIPYLVCDWRNIIKCSDYLKENVQSIRIPVMVVFKNGDIFIECEAHGNNEEILFRLFAISDNYGESFMINKSDYSVDEFIYDANSDLLFGITTKLVYCSSNHGQTWFEYSKLNLKVPNGFESITTCPTAGIQLEDGTLVCPIRAIKWKNKGDKSQTIDDETGFLIFSTDHGLTWKQTCSYPDNILCDEVVIAPYKRNSIILNARGGTEYFWNQTMNGRRVLIGRFKKSFGRVRCFKAWKTDKKTDGKMWDCLCNASFIKVINYVNSFYLFCFPYIPYQYFPRRNLCINISKDGLNWKPIGIVTKPGEVVYGYSALGEDNAGNIYMVYEARTGIKFSKINSVLSDYFN